MKKKFDPEKQYKSLLRQQEELLRQLNEQHIRENAEQTINFHESQRKKQQSAKKSCTTPES